MGPWALRNLHLADNALEAVEQHNSSQYSPSQHNSSDPDDFAEGEETPAALRIQVALAADDSQPLLVQVRCWCELLCTV